ncbi:hypothetical protein [Flavobacterium marginilacus]|uniref:hypothetical protein n=1 Tax=Flavobacterium marginilacus TaxID=3003256 RepID=UPI00248EB46F|nr:hypothetical protein [Flavobacterium marginilacus]
MTPDKNGKFCNSCNKTVVDFRKMENLEIRKYLVENSGNESVCGHFKANQVETGNNIRYSNLRNRISRIRIKPIKKAALFSLSILFTLSSCMGKAAIDGEPAIENDTINENEILKKEQNTEKQNDSIKKEIIQRKQK